MSNFSTFWILSGDQVLEETHSTKNGLSGQDAKQRLRDNGANSLQQKHKSSTLLLLLDQFRSPIILILIFAAVLSIFLQDAADAVIILIIVFISGLLGFWQEKSASNAAEKLLALVQDKQSSVLPAETGLGKRTNSLYMGTNVISGTGKAIVVHTGKETEFGKVSERLKLRPTETEFERGLSCYSSKLDIWAGKMPTPQYLN